VSSSPICVTFLFLIWSSRATIHPIISRLSVDTLIGQMSRFREDDRFKAVGPDSIVLSVTNQAVALQPSTKHTDAEGGEIWFDWAFVDFWKSNYCQPSSRFSPLYCSSQSFLFWKIPSNADFPPNLISSRHHLVCCSLIMECVLLTVVQVKMRKLLS